MMPASLKNLSAISSRLKTALARQEKIILYGDADLDGIGAVLILKETLMSLGGKVERVYFPDLEKSRLKNYSQALKDLSKVTPGLLLFFDTGSGDLEVMAKFSQKGFELIIIDHHQMLTEPAKNILILNPKQPGDKSDFKDFSSAGLSFKLAEQLLAQNFSQALRQSFLEIVALATLYDMMAREAENEVWIAEGVRSLPQSFRPGLQACLELPQVVESKDAYQLANKIVSILAAGESADNNLNQTYLLLSATDLSEARTLAEILAKQAEQKKVQVQAIFEQVMARHSQDCARQFVFEGDSHWPRTVLGSVASKVLQKLKLPVFLYSQKRGLSIGTVRVPEGVNSIEAMAGCAKVLENFGGHAKASGFTIKNKNLPKFKHCLTQYFPKN